MEIPRTLIGHALHVASLTGLHRGVRIKSLDNKLDGCWILMESGFVFEVYLNENLIGVAIWAAAMGC